jgi:hypothetical protein
MKQGVELELLVKGFCLGGMSEASERTGKIFLVCVCVCVCVCVVLVIESRAEHMLGKCYSTKLYH